MQDGFAFFHLKVAPLKACQGVSQTGVHGTFGRNSLGDEVLSEKVSFSGQESGWWAEGERALEAVSRGRHGDVEGAAIREYRCVCACLRISGDMPRMPLVSDMTTKILCAEFYRFPAFSHLIQAWQAELTRGSHTDPGSAGAKAAA